ncbi:sensor histidine kinase [Rhizorhabdus argentea]|uniref:sensor histidine kinase n=1 Tax=Rhizorhabdus argentea TaxID=1387174 RepID=UPI0030ECE800
MKLTTKLAFARLSTGTKMLMILSAAMLPLGFIALLTSLDMARSASLESRTAAQTTTAMYAAQLDAALKAGLDTVRGAAVSVQAPQNLCAALSRQAQFTGIRRLPTAMFDRAGRKLCQSFGAPIRLATTVPPETDRLELDPQRRLFRFTSARADGSVIIQSELRLAAIHLNRRQEEGLPLTHLRLRQGDAMLVLLNRPTKGDDNLLRLSQPLAGGRLTLSAEYRLAPVRARTLLLVMLPILMWAAAAFTGWFIVSRLLVLPLVQLKESIDAWQGTGGPLILPRINTPSHEIRDLAESFATVSARIYNHERELEEGLARQTKLTREVHHRVKNNLQVVSSLINLHARGAEGAVADAYGAIQRRVDALAVVHRNHYAELEENRGVSMRSLAGELASSLRASAPASAAGMSIALNMIDVYVTQDVAVPAAFLITEVVELLMHCNPVGSVLISLERTDRPDRANLRIETVGMPEGAFDRYSGITRFERVVTGIARQFRAPLAEDLHAGRFEIQISILG